MLQLDGVSSAGSDRWVCEGEYITELLMTDLYCSTGFTQSWLNGGNEAVLFLCHDAETLYSAVL